MQSFFLFLNPNMVTSKSSPGHLVGMNRPDEIFVLKKASLTVMRWDAGAPSNHNFALLEQNPADFPELDTEDGAHPGIVARNHSLIAIFSFTSEVGPTQQPLFTDIDYPIVGDVLGLYGWTEIGFTSLSYILALQGEYRPFTAMERVKGAIMRKRPLTEMANHVGANWDVHLPS